MQSSPVQAQAYLPTHATGGSLPSKPSNRGPSDQSSASSESTSAAPENLEKSTILFTGKCNREFRASLSKGESLREDRNKGIWGQSLSQIRVISIKVWPSKSCIKKRLLTIMQPGRLKYDLNHGFIYIVNVAR